MTWERCEKVGAFEALGVGKQMIHQQTPEQKRRQKQQEEDWRKSKEVEQKLINRFKKAVGSQWPDCFFL